MSSSTPFPLVSFPTSESASASLTVPHLPFRRISLPSTSNIALAAHRQSVGSFTSVTSLVEEPAVHQHRRIKRRSLNPATRPHRRTHVDQERHAKRAKIIAEFYATEKSYLDGLDLVYNHFLTPILASLDTPKPLLTRNEITTLFSNFIDIWNFHHTFFAALSALLHPPSATSSSASSSTPFSSLLLAHFPYLSLYSPFITAFPTSLAFLSSVSGPSMTNAAFTTFLRTQEAHPACARLRLSDYLLTPVQRCPRYLLLLKDLLNATDPAEAEWGRLQDARALVEKITTSLNTSLAAHAKSLALLSLQRNTRDLPPVLTPLVVPGRELLKRGTLTRQAGEGEGGWRKSFEFLLLSDYLLWLELEDTGILAFDPGSPGARKRRSSTNALNIGGDEDKWLCKGCMSLVDMEVVVAMDRPRSTGTSPTNGGEERLEILSPDGSFALYAIDSEDPNGLMSWVTALRNARAAHLVALARSNPDSTLSASTSGVHLRRALRAFASEGDDDVGVFSEGDALPTLNQDGGSPSTKLPRSRPRRAQLDSFLPPVWVPDARTDTCMRCARPFGFGPGGGGAWRRKHHCRLCGRVVCAACSNKTFYITNADPEPSPSPLRTKAKAKSARACDECFEAAFPILSPAPESLRHLPPSPSGRQPAISSQPSGQASSTSSTPPPDQDPDTIRGIQPWLSIPSRQGPERDRLVHLPRVSSGDSTSPASSSPLAQQFTDNQLNEHDDDRVTPEDRGSPITRPIRIRPSQARPRSYHDILEDFSMHDRDVSVPSSVSSAGTPLGSVRERAEEDEVQIGDDEPNPGDAFYMQETVSDGSAELTLQDATDDAMVQREDTARRRKRFSLPAVALQTTPVLARPREEGRLARDGDEGGAKRRFSVALGSGGGGKERGKKEKDGGKESTAVGLLMDMLRGRAKHIGRP
ncbi:hypothetical protein F5I97DRAFT_1808565 [Phlebopus sp. FC_14]|nr:hypothetical protein F5I97DRAFT_1808565 [Phlebopus sp. FC_14]